MPFPMEKFPFLYFCYHELHMGISNKYPNRECEFIHTITAFLLTRLLMADAFNKMSMNKIQLTCLVNAMVENPDIGKGFHRESKEKIQAFWRSLHDSLNSKGPPTKSISEWKKVWIDQKRYVRKKAVQNAQNRKKTGGGPCKEHVFSVLEQSILDLTAMMESVEGVEGGLTFGFKPAKAIEERPSAIECDPNEELGTDIQEGSFHEIPVCEESMQTETNNRQKRQSQNKLNPSDLLSKELNIQKEITANIGKGVEMSAKHHKEVERQLRKVKELIDLLQESQENILQESKRHHLEMERLKKIEVNRNIEVMNRQIQVQDLKILALKQRLGIE